jgi:hypothetical protein
MRLYLAGPMRGYPKWNFPAFDRWTSDLRTWGYEVVSPAELDRAAGFDEDLDVPLPDGFVEAALRRDIEALLRVDAIALMPGWRTSSGVAIELTVAMALGLPPYEVCDGGLVDMVPESALHEAQRLVHGRRREDYGHPADDFTRTGRMWGAILGRDDVPPEHVGLCMAALKISREVNRPQRDNRVDLAGYAETVELIHQRRAGE